MSRLCPAPLIFGLCVGLLAPASGGAAEPQLRIPAHLHDAGAALSLTFDDGLREHADLVLPALAAADLRASFFVVAGRTPDNLSEARRREPQEMGAVSWQEWRLAAAGGHEIANKSWSHPYLTRIGEARLNKEVLVAQKSIANKVGAAVQTFAYPFEAFDQKVVDLVAASHPWQRQRVQPCGSFGLDLTGMQEWLRQLQDKGEWGVAQFGAIDHGHAPFGAQAFAKLLRQLQSAQPALWVAPYAEVAAHRHAAEHLRLHLQQLPTAWELSWSYREAEAAPLPRRLTIIVEGLPAAQLQALRGLQDGLPLTSHWRAEPPARLFEIAPAGGSVSLSTDVAAD